MHQTFILPNGLKIIQESSPSDTVYCGLFIDAGTKDEEELDTGLAHFCEHTSFKGTQKRKSWQIRNYLESVGGDLNAYTNKEETVYYATVLKENFNRAAALLFDIVFHSVYPQKELDKETEVIIDEIDCYNDSPAELIYDEFEEIIFKGHGLGRNILGKAERLRTYKTADALRFTQKYYIPSNTTFFIYGNVPFQHIVRLAEKYTLDLPATKLVKQQTPLPIYVATTKTSNQQTHQAHVLIGNRAYGYHHPKRYVLSLLNNMIGGPGMNSMLNVLLREKRGLVYTTESTLFNYQEAGLWSIYFGCDEDDVATCQKIIYKLLNQLTTTPLSNKKVEEAKKQMTGQLRISQDNFESHALALGKSFARNAQIRTIEEVCQQINAITPQDLFLVAQDIFQTNNITTLIYK